MAWPPGSRPVLTIIPIIYDVDTERLPVLPRLHQTRRWLQEDIESLLPFIESIIVDDNYAVRGGLVGFKGHDGIRGERFKVLVGGGCVGTSEA